MLKVRKWLTEILLEVTNAEIHSIAKEVLLKAKNRGIFYIKGSNVNISYDYLKIKAIIKKQFYYCYNLFVYKLLIKLNIYF
jgi:hypothetical protein